MLEFTIGGIRCKLSLLFPAVMLYLLYADPSGISLFGFAAAILHECGHVLAAIVLHDRPKELTVSCFGMRLLMEKSFLTRPVDDVLIALAGPAANTLAALMLCFLNVDPLYAKLHLVIAVFNLLPILPLDGGRVVKSIMLRYTHPLYADRIEVVFCIAILLPLTVLGVMLVYYPPHNITLLLVCIYLVILRLFYNGN